MNKRSRCWVVFVWLAAIVISVPGVVEAQKFRDVKDVGYIQLPGVSAEYQRAHVFVLQEKNAVEKKVSGMLGGLAKKSKNDKVASGIEEFAEKAIGGQVEFDSEWQLLPADFPMDDDKLVKVVVSYKPDNGFKPVGEPMKNNDQQYQFSYNTNAKMKLYDADNNLLMEKDFGYLDGMATSETWPKKGGDGKKGFGISIGKDKDKGGDDGDDTHPYTIACKEGALDHARRIVYGMFGVRKIEDLQMHVLWTKNNKATKDFAKDYEDLVEGMDDLVLNTEEKIKMQKLVEKWEAKLPKVKSKDKWLIHYNLAAGYGWLQNPDKSKEHIAKVAELKQDLFDKIADKSGNWGTKDINTLAAYNSLRPFAEYYAAGLTNYPDYNWDKGLPYVPAFVTARNIMISETFGLPAPVPFYPVEKKAEYRKGEGKIKHKGKVIAEFKYDYKSDKLEEMELRGKAGVFEKIKQDFTVPDNSDNHPGHMNRYYDGIDKTGGWGYKSVKYESDYVLDTRWGKNGFFYEGNFSIGLPFQLFRTEDIKGNYEVSTPYFKNIGVLEADINEKGFVKQMAFKIEKYPSQFVAVFHKGDDYKVDITTSQFLNSYKVVETDDYGNPVKVEHICSLGNALFEASDDIKEKYVEIARQNGAKVEKLDDNNYNFDFKKTIAMKVETNGKGDWTRITMGDYELSREFK